MVPPNPYQQYRHNAVLTADPGRLTLMLFQGAARFTLQAAARVAQKDVPGAHEACLRAQDILLYLLETANTEVEVGKNLASLYDYLYRRLVEANVKKDRFILEEVAGFLEELAHTWEQALRQVAAQQAG